MVKWIALFGALALMMTTAAAQQAITIDGQTFPLHCWQWKKNPDGSWSTLGIVHVDHFTLANVTLKRTKAVQVLDWTCLPR
jgi:hypothetical protein